jgi:preprotein translocase subunit SecD
MSLGLDLRGGVYFLLEVDMDTAITSRLTLYEQNFNQVLRDAGIRNRVDLDGRTITVRLTGEEDAERARRLIRDADSDVLVLDGDDAKSLRVLMS